jgi:hypothetical protein
MGGAFPGEKKHNTVDKQDNLGQCYKVEDPLGGTYRWMYVKASAAVTAGNVVMMDNAEETVANITSALNTGDRAAGVYPSVTDSGETWTVNEHKGAFLYVAGGTGAGQMKRIVSNTATTAYLRAIHPNMGETDPFTTALSTDSDVVIINPWHVKPTATAAVNPTLGQAPFAFTSLYYGYILVPKEPTITFVKAGGTLTINHYVIADDDTAGQVVDATVLVAETVVGKALHASAADQYGPIHLQDL